MKAKAAVMRAAHEPLTIEEIEIDEPARREVLVRTVYAGVCHSDLHFIEGLYPIPCPCVLGHESAKIKKIIKKNKKIIFVINKKYKSGMSSSIKAGLKKISKKDNGFIIVQSDMPFIKTTIINKICTSIIKKKYLIQAPKFKKKIGNPLGFDISLISKFKKIQGKIGAKFIVKRLEKSTNFIKVSSGKFFKDFDLSKDFN